MHFCVRCARNQYCRNIKVPLFEMEEIRRAEFQVDFRLFLTLYTFKTRLKFSDWLACRDHLTVLHGIPFLSEH